MVEYMYVHVHVFVLVTIYTIRHNMHVLYMYTSIVRYTVYTTVYICILVANLFIGDDVILDKLVSLLAHIAYCLYM